MRKSLLLSVALTCIFSATTAQDWQPLFNGKNLDGWKTEGGKAKFKVENGELVGIAVKNSPNTFLVTEERFSDFILEVDVFLGNDLNTGVQFRSNVRKEGDLNRVFGYQVEVDHTPRDWTGGIFDEGRRKWMYPLSRNRKAQGAFRMGVWNTIRIECKGQYINTFINGMQASRLVDDMTAEGFIGLQVHSMGKDLHKEGFVIRFKNIRIITKNVEEYLTKPDPEVPEVSYLKNQLTPWEVDHGFRLLWDGKTSKGWRGAKLDDFPASGWEIEDGILTVLATDGGEATGPGDIVTTKMYGDFELELEFKITEGANSGVKYFVDPELNKGAGSAIGCEFQILDNSKHPDAKKGVRGNRTIGSLYDLIPAGSIDENIPIKKAYKDIGEWNKCRIVSKEGKVEHWLNNVKVVEYDRFSQMFKALVNYSKYKDWKNFGRWPEGTILLQDHGDEVSYRSIKIREL